ncbi:MAG: helix-turn-helix domain-containing protein [bacterium]|nr:helix-turn-helix domain-containing protein [bacterium]
MNTKTDDKKIDPNSLKNADFLEKILRGVESVDNKEISVNVKSKKFKPKESFVIMFTGVTLEIINKLSFAEFKVLLAYSHFMQYGNQISISQQDIADYIHMARSNVARCLKKLKNLGIMYSPIDAPRSLYMNPGYIAKGDLTQFKEKIEMFEAMIEADKKRIEETKMLEK